VPPGGRGGSGQRRALDRDPALGEPARKEAQVQVDHGLAGVEGGARWEDPGGGVQ
jgi:hypothetical protein